MKKNAVFIKEQPKHSIITFIVFPDNTELPISEEIQGNIDNLEKESDLFFIMSPKFASEINVDKFTTLFGGKSYIIGEANSCLLQSFLYSLEIFKKYRSFLVTDINKLKNIDINSKVLGNIISINISTIVKPIFVTSRLSPEELQEQYKKYPWWNWWKNNSMNQYSTHKSESPILFFRKFTLENILNNYEDPDFKKYLATFSGQSVDYFLSSYLEKLQIETINGNIGELNISEWR